MADAKDSKSFGRKVVWVQVPPRAPTSRWNTGGVMGVKLEEMVRINESGCELVGRFPFEEDSLPRDRIFSD